MKLLILGARGQVGHELRRALAPLGTLVCATRDGLLEDGSPALAIDLARPEALAQALDASGADVIVNAAAYTAVDRAETEEELAQRINGKAVGVIGRWAAEHGVPVVHYSTDYVFDGNGSQPLRADDPVGPVSAYGRTKLAGEQALAGSGCDHLILRTAWVYAAHGHNFLRTMLRLGAERDRLTVVDDQLGTPTPAALIADVTAAVLTRWLGTDAETRRQQSGTYHLVASGQTTWCGFARAIMSRAVEAGLLERAPAVEAIPSSAFPTPAKRPAWSVLDTRHLRETFDLDLPGWEAGLDAVIAELTGEHTRQA